MDYVDLCDREGHPRNNRILALLNGCGHVCQAMYAKACSDLPKIARGPR